MKHSFFLLSGITAFCLSLFLAPSVHAGFITNEQIRIAPQSDAGVYVGDEIVIEGKQEKDLTIIGNKVRIEGDIQGSLFIVGNEIEAKKSSLQSLRVVAQSLHIEQSKFQRSVQGVVSDFSSDKESTFSDWVFLSGALAHVSGTFEHLELNFTELHLANKVNGYLITRSTETHLDPSFEYHGTYEQTAPEQVQLSGSSSEHFKFSSIHEEKNHSFGFLIPIFFALLFLQGVAVYFASPILHTRIGYMKDNPLGSFLAGMVWLVALPFCLLLCSFTFIGLFAAFIGGWLYILTLMMSPILLGFFYGSILLQHFYHYDEGPTKKMLFGVGLVGTMVMLVIQLVPVFGLFANLLLGLIALGSLFQNKSHYFGVFPKN